MYYLELSLEGPPLKLSLKRFEWVLIRAVTDVGGIAVEDKMEQRYAIASLPMSDIISDTFTLYYCL